MTTEDNSTHKYPILVKLCSEKAAYEARTTQKLFLNMDDAKKALEESREHEIVICTPHLLILKSGNAETTLSKDGRMLIKRVSSESEAAQVAQQILQTIIKAKFKP